MPIRRLGPGDMEALDQVSPLFDHPVREEAGRRFLDAEGHHAALATYAAAGAVREAESVMLCWRFG